MDFDFLKISPALKIDASKPPASADEINALAASSSVPLPDTYLSLIRVITDIEFQVNGHKYIRLWGPARAIEMNKAYEIRENIPNSLAIGDDEGGMALILMTGKQGFGLYKVGFGDLDADDAEYIASSLEEFLVNGIGIDRI